MGKFVIMKTQMQSVEMIKPKSTKIIMTVEQSPMCPYMTPEMMTEPVRLELDSGDVYTWYETGQITIALKDGTRLYFHARPTMEDAVKCSDGGTYFRFFEDGSVEQTMYEGGPVYWWGPEIKYKRYSDFREQKKKTSGTTTIKY